MGYHEAQVVELDFESNVKRVKFHFHRLSSDRDEWIEVGSPRIAPHVSSCTFSSQHILLHEPSNDVSDTNDLKARIHAEASRRLRGTQKEAGLNAKRRFAPEEKDRHS